MSFAHGLRPEFRFPNGLCIIIIIIIIIDGRENKFTSAIVITCRPILTSR